MELNVFILGIIIFFARIVDVSLGTIRTIAIVQGKTILSFFLGLFEVLIWISVVSNVVTNLKDNPILIVFFSLGYASGNVVGILAEKKLNFGISILRVISCTKCCEITDRIRKTGQAVTIFKGEGLKGPVYELYTALRQKDLDFVLSIIREEDPDAFFVVEQAKASSRRLGSFSVSPHKFVPTIEISRKPISVDM